MRSCCKSLAISRRMSAYFKEHAFMYLSMAKLHGFSPHLAVIVHSHDDGYL